MTLDILLREKRKRWTGSRRGIVQPPLFSRASNADAAEPVWSAVTVPNVTRRGLSSRRNRSTQNLDPSGWPRSMNPRSVASWNAYLRPRRCAASARASLRRMRSAEDATAASRRRLDRGCATPLRFNPQSPCVPLCRVACRIQQPLDRAGVAPRAQVNRRGPCAYTHGDCNGPAPRRAAIRRGGDHDYQTYRHSGSRAGRSVGVQSRHAAGSHRDPAHLRHRSRGLGRSCDGRAPSGRLSRPDTDDPSDGRGHQHSGPSCTCSSVPTRR